MPPRLLLGLTLAAVVTTPGCCTLSRLFCGPDRTPWVPRDYSTPEATVATFLEAIRRDNPEVLYLCLAEGLKKARGVDSLQVIAAWKQFRADNPGVHLLGYADPGQALERTPRTAAFAFAVQGHAVRMALVQQTFWEIAWREGDGTVRERGAYTANLRDLAEVTADPEADRSRLVLAPLQFAHDGRSSVPLDALERAGIGREWKIGAIRVDDVDF